MKDEKREAERVRHHGASLCTVYYALGALFAFVSPYCILLALQTVVRYETDVSTSREATSASNTFYSSDLKELPPRLRAMLEDNKVIGLHDHNHAPSSPSSLLPFWALVLNLYFIGMGKTS